ncbi:hypothetical protein [Streptomyces axinellae]|uniref:hypothetical protein n=1 Tax=Streptomyces axinellae TaxID=552788 RepID=UPI0031E44B27
MAWSDVVGAGETDEEGFRGFRWSGADSEGKRRQHLTDAAALPYSSWISQVERWFAELGTRRPKRGVFCSFDELKTALEDRIKTWNEQEQPLRWIQSADKIDRICRYCDRVSGRRHQVGIRGEDSKSFSQNSPQRGPRIGEGGSSASEDPPSPDASPVGTAGFEPTTP